MNVRSREQNKEKRKRKGGARRVGQTKADGELDPPAAVQAALVIPWEAWAEDDAAEVCHRAATVS